VGFTKDLTRRLAEHKKNRGRFKTFTGRYYCYHLVYYEIYQYVNNAIAREKQIKRWSREKKERLINEYNPGWKVLNREFLFKE
jgi:putative endonuclease